jgi:glucan endo-1,6-beta-glucosidase
MTERIHTNANYDSVFMLQVMNEPVHSGDYPGEAADMVANFYPQALERIRGKEDELGVGADRQLHVQYMSEAWGAGDPTSALPAETGPLGFDDHRYLKWDTSVVRTREGYIQAACSDNRGGDDVLVGEWSISVADDVEHSPEFSIDADANNGAVDWYRRFWAAQVTAYERSGGWVFWTWRCNWIGARDEWRWCYQSAVAAGVIPEDAGSAASIGAC